MAHILVVGGTGMLGGVSAYLASQGHCVSVIGRRPEPFRDLETSTKHYAGTIYPMMLDYRNLDLLRQKLDESISSLGKIETAVAWIHSTAPEAPFIIADHVARHSGRYFDILGSAWADPSRVNVRRSIRFQTFEKLLYRRVILGFIQEQGHSRWLTHEEISGGIIQAIEQDAPTSIVGVVDPWSARP